MTNLVAERFEDMSVRGRLRVLQDGDGDMIVCVITDPNSAHGFQVADVEFCTSGGKSPKTREALRLLMYAIAEDNAEQPKCHRRGEDGLGVTEFSRETFADRVRLLYNELHSNDTDTHK